MPTLRTLGEAEGSVSGLEAAAVEVIEEAAVVEAIKEAAAVEVIEVVAAVKEIEEAATVEEMEVVTAVEEIEEVAAVEKIEVIAVEGIEEAALVEEKRVTEEEPEHLWEIPEPPATGREDDWFLLLETLTGRSSYMPTGIFPRDPSLHWFSTDENSIRTHILSSSY